MSNLGKRVFDELYVHLNVASRLPEQWQVDQISRAIERLVGLPGMRPNVAKLNLKTRRLSLLAYL